MMKKALAVSLLAVAVLVMTVAPSHARKGHSHTRVFVGFGPAFWWGPAYPWWWYYPPYAYYPPPVVVREPPVYIQQPVQPSSAETPQAYWYYCPSSQAYYPNVESCPEAWVKVPPRTQ